MKEIHQKLIFLGYQIINPDTLVRIFKKEDALTEDVPNIQTNVYNPSTSSYPAPHPDLLFRIKQEEDWYNKDWYDSEDPEAGDNFTNSDVLLRKRGKENQYFKDTEEGENLDCNSPEHAVVSFIAKEEQEPYNIEHQHCESKESRKSFTEHAVVSFIAKEEQEPYNIEHQHCESKESRKSFTEHAVVSFIAKEEQEPYNIEHQNCERKESRKSFTGEAIVIPNEKDTDYEKHPKEISCKTLLKEVGMSDPERSERETRTKSQLWAGGNQNHEEEVETVCEQELINASGFNSKPRTTVPHTSVTHDECDRNGTVAKLSTFKTKTQPKRRPYVCMVCGKSFYQRGHFNVHLRIHSGEKPHQCTQCGKSFCQKNNLTRHQRIHTRTQNWEILTKRTLPNVFTENEGTSRLQPNVIIQERNRTQPDQPTMREQSISDKKHLVAQNTVNFTQTPYQNNNFGNVVCQIVPSIVQQDTNRETGPNQYPKCEKSFDRVRQLLQHHKKLAGTRCYHCTVCEKSFSQKGHVISHQRTYSGERPYQCDKCKKSFCQKNNLTRHLRIHSGERHFQCTECGKEFSKKESFVDHTKTQCIP